MKKKLSAVLAMAMLVCGSTVMAEDVVSLDGVKGMTTMTGSGGGTLNHEPKPIEITGADRYTGEEIEESILKTRDVLVKAKNTAEGMAYMKRNPIKGDLQNFDVGAHKDITDLMTDLNSIFGTDQSLFSEKDPVAVPMIPVGDTGYKLPTDTVLPVIGTSNLQGIPIEVNGKMIGHFRAVCGGYQTDDVLINQRSVSYCVTSMRATGVSRNSGVHKDATTDVFFYGVTEPYEVGKVSSVKVHWVLHPKGGLDKVIKHYNLDKVPHAKNTLEFRNNLTLADGTKLAGTNAKDVK